MTEQAAHNQVPLSDAGLTHRRGTDHVNIHRGDVVRGIATYSPQDQDDLIWLHGYALDVLHGSRSALVEFAGCDWTTIWRIWTNKYGADISNFIEKIRILRKKSETGSRTAFVPTPVTDKIWQVCDVAKDQGTIVMVSGPTGRSKTHTVKEWKSQNNHGRALYIYAPELGGFRGFVLALAKALGISREGDTASLAGQIENALDCRNVLIIDEVAHLFPTGRAASLQALEFIRGLHDRTGCGIILVCTEIFPQMMSGGRFSMWFEQLQGRVELQLKIPANFSRREIAAICSAYVDEPSGALIDTARKIANARRGGVRELFRHLNRASDASAIVKQPLNAEVLRKVYERSLEIMTIPNED